MTYADVIIDITSEKLDHSFQYRIPEQWKNSIVLGGVVSVPFGRGNAIQKGYVIGFSETPKYEPEKIKEIIDVLSDEETTESKMVMLAAWMKENCGSTMIQALKTVLPIRKKIQGKQKRYVYLSVSEQDAQQYLETIRGSRYKARIRLLEALLEKNGREYSELNSLLGISKSVIDFFVEQNMIQITEEQILRFALKQEKVQISKNPLYPEQKEIVQSIEREWRSGTGRPVLLHGVTGSGKTQIYMELIDQVIASGKQAIVLIPEIALTYQTVSRFRKHFGNRVSIINSQMSQGERYDQFRMAKQGTIQIMVGPRSALFTPFDRLGLIVIDEEHEPTYKSETTPRYDAREVALQRAKMENAHLIMGSATPSMESYYRAEAGEYFLVELKKRFEERPLPSVAIVDLREELKAGNRSIISRELKQKMQSRLARKEQIMLFLNRRGYAGFVSCRSCGQAMKCVHCDIALSEHSNGKLVCHYCGYEIPKPRKCPVCGSPYIGGFKAGTQQIEAVLKKEFPDAAILRMDFDTTRKKGSYEEILSAFSAHKADILVGTQMIVKGHDFPDVTLVGILAADMSLNGGDYNCSERTFQLLTQAIGRAGRGKLEGEAVIQTYSPEHYSIIAAAKQDYQEFYRQEIGYRVLMDYPPGAHMLAVLGSCEDEELLEKAMKFIELFIKKVYKEPDLSLIGPAPAAVKKVRDVYRSVLYLKHTEYDRLVYIKDKLEQYIEMNTGFNKIFIQFDFS
ncbi:MAG: primosomal protein N' [Eubacteriales bacterium]|nr:primosomal protein N' [Eubacteriales bacterium]